MPLMKDRLVTKIDDQFISINRIINKKVRKVQFHIDDVKKKTIILYEHIKGEKPTFEEAVFEDEA